MGLTSGLTGQEEGRLSELENVVSRGMETFLEVGSALIEIRDRRLYRASHGTFDDYCRGRWGMSRRHADRLVQSAQVVADLRPMGLIPTSERQVRPLVDLPSGDRQAAWDLAVETAPEGKVTGKHVQSVVDRVVPRPPKPKPKAAPRVVIAAPPPPSAPALDEEALAAAIEDEWSSPDPPAEEPPDIAALRRAGIIPDGVEVDVREPDRADEDEPLDVMAEQTDEEFLAECPARAGLNGPCLKVFDRDALLFRAVAGHRDKFRRRVKPLINANKRRGPTGNYHYYLTSFLIRKHPRQWVACDFCGGTGQEELIGKCHNCHGSGYLA